MYPKNLNDAFDMFLEKYLLKLDEALSEEKDLSTEAETLIMEFHDYLESVQKLIPE